MTDISTFILENLESDFTPTNKDVIMLDDKTFKNGRLTVFNRHGDKTVGVFATKDTKLSDRDLLKLDSSDDKFIKDSGVKLKQHEHVFRYETDTTRVGGMKPLVKININKGLVYFNVGDSDKDELVFDKKGIKVNYMKLLKSYFK